MCKNLNRKYIYCSSVDSIHFSTREAAQAREQRSLLTLTRLWHLSAAFQQKITPRRLTPQKTPLKSKKSVDSFQKKITTRHIPP